jgi:hypothetical protein
MADRIYVGEVGTIIDVDMGVDISLASAYELRVRKPDGTEVIWAPAILSGGQTLEYITETGDLDIAGDWIIQPWLEIGTWIGYGDPVNLVVYSIYSEEGM